MYLLSGNLCDGVGCLLSGKDPCMHVHLHVHTCMYMYVHLHVHVCMYPFQALQKLSTSDVTPKALRDMSDNVLLLVTTTIEHMEEVG